MGNKTVYAVRVGWEKELGIITNDEFSNLDEARARYLLVSAGLGYQWVKLTKSGHSRDGCLCCDLVEYEIDSEGKAVSDETMLGSRIVGKRTDSSY